MTDEERQAQYEADKEERATRKQIRASEIASFANAALSKKEIRKTVHVWIPQVNPFSEDDAVCVVRNKKDPERPDGTSGKNEGWGMPGGGVELLFKIISGVVPSLSQEKLLTTAALESMSIELLELNAISLDKFDNRLDTLLRNYPYGTELPLSISMNGENATLLIAAQREETLAEAVIRETRAETGRHIDVVTFGKQSWVWAEPSHRKDHVNYVVFGRFTRAHMDAPTETDETDQWCFASLGNSIREIWTKTPGCRLYFKHAKRIQQARHAIKKLISESENERGSYSPGYGVVDESWGYCFGVMGKSFLPWKAGDAYYLIMNELDEAGKDAVDIEMYRKLFPEEQKYFSGSMEIADDEKRVTEPIVATGEITIIETESGHQEPTALLTGQEQYNEKVEWEDWLKKP